ncbi:DNA-binding protein [Acinetobacter nosocomialis]|uniref:DNA-binding protein n=1 Tax=Acinetobacter nosocomialis TaxID=106654 RepID=UPI002577A205|nr:DNA-binding protein [Acinetobacter nosocomialis]WJI03028.1 DNA-binding protein [Acinetobacter nosocomialis]
MRTHEEMKALALSRSAVRTEYERIEREEMPLLDMVLTARREAGLSSANRGTRGNKCPLPFHG